MKNLRIFLALAALAVIYPAWAYEETAAKPGDSANVIPKGSDSAAIMRELRRLDNAQKALDARMNRLEDGNLPKVWKPEAVSGIVLPDNLLDSAALSDFTPSFLGIERGTKYDSGFPALTFTFFQGFSVPVVNYIRNPGFGYTLAFCGAYHGGYDFDKENHSGPVISRFQNPLVYFPMRFSWGDFKRHSVPLYPGWAHESNGQFIESESDAGRFDSLNPGKSYFAQDFASMGWNYWWLRTGYELRAPSPSCPHVSAIGISAEFRYHVEQTSLFQRTGLEDTSLFNGSRTSGGIKGYDGTRIALWMKYSRRKSSDLVILAHFQTAEIGNGSFLEFPSYGLMLFPTFYFCGTYRLPLFIGASSAYKHELSNYTRQMKQVNVGVLLSTSSFIQENFKSGKKQAD